MAATEIDAANSDSLSTDSANSTPLSPLNSTEDSASSSAPATMPPGTLQDLQRAAEYKHNKDQTCEGQEAAAVAPVVNLAASTATASALSAAALPALAAEAEAAKTAATDGTGTKPIQPAAQQDVDSDDQMLLKPDAASKGNEFARQLEDANGCKPTEAPPAPPSVPIHAGAAGTAGPELLRQQVKQLLHASPLMLLPPGRASSPLGIVRPRLGEPCTARRSPPDMASINGPVLRAQNADHKRHMLENGSTNNGNGSVKRTKSDQSSAQPPPPSAAAAANSNANMVEQHQMVVYGKGSLSNRFGELAGDELREKIFSVYKARKVT
jgi:hypothetical protein